MFINHQTELASREARYHEVIQCNLCLCVI
jgi:hypothetical protein